MGRTSNKGVLILQYLRDFMRENHYAPSVREIGEAVGLRSTSSVHYQLSRLQEQGLLQFDPAKNRSVTLTDSPFRVPVVGVVPAGQPVLAVENVEGYLPWEAEEGSFALRVQGNSMKNAGILPGDLVIVRQQSTADDGQIVVALLGEEATVKRLSRQNGHVRLLPENEAYSPIDGDDAAILGVVKTVIREY